jgi:hypothetical protein
MRQAERLCGEQGIEIAFPKPFCDFDPPRGSFLARFRQEFHIGRPEVELTVKDGVIRSADVKVSAPCGATYYVARWLKGKSLRDDLKYEVVSKRLHAYPCTSSMEWDHDLGDTILHVAGKNHYAILDPLELEDDAEDEVLLSPLGKSVPKPVPVAENVRNIEEAKDDILRAAEQEEGLPLSEMRARTRSPAAASTALIILRREGRVRIEAGRVVKP